MKASTILAEFLLLAIALSGCGLNWIGDLRATKTPTPTDTPTWTPTGTAIPSLTPSPTPHYLPLPLSEMLSAGQYLAYAEGCDSVNFELACNLRAVSVGGSVDVLIAEHLPSSEFVYREGKIAFRIDYSDASGNNRGYGIRVLDLESGEMFDVPKPRGQDCFPEDWSPDGAFLTLICDDHEGVQTVVLVSVPAGQPTVLLNNSVERYHCYGYSDPRWSPDGKWFSYYLVSLCGGGVSPDELYIVDASCRNEPSFCRSRAQLLPVIKPAEEDYSRFAALWTPDNRLAVGFENHIDVYDVISRQRIRTYQADPDLSGIAEMAWSLDGQWIAVTQYYSYVPMIIPVHGGESLHLDISAENLFWITVP